MAPAFELRSLFDSYREPRATKQDRRNVDEFMQQWKWVPKKFLSASEQNEDLHMFVSLPENLDSEPVATTDFDLVSVESQHQSCVGIVGKVREWAFAHPPILQSLRLSKDCSADVKLQSYSWTAALSSAMGSWNSLPCEREVFAALSEVQTIRILRGKVERVDGDLAYVTLTDERGRETFADCSAAELEGRGISEGKFFECRIEDRSAETVVTIGPIPERRLSRREWKDLSDRVRESLSGYDLNDDY
jgi:hypothetical protein